MLDLAARVSAEVRGPAVLDAVAGRLNLTISTGRFLFATVHRAENRSPEAIAAWAMLFGAVATPERPLVLALHPGTKVAIETAGLVLPPNVIVIEPQGYRTSLALQLHAAAVLTDSGGIQRESAWLGVPCLVLRDTTEWVETVGGADSSAVLVGLDRSAAVRELAARAPQESSARQAADRAANLRLMPAGAGARISAALASAESPVEVGT
jgi:UDP-N-acetylglucosamine 2-epimerase